MVMTSLSLTVITFRFQEILNMNQEQKIQRRRFVKLAVGSAVVVPFFTNHQAIAAGHMPRVEESDPQATALGYKHDTNDVDASAYANHDPSQVCTGCNLYQGKEGDEWGPCAIFPGKEVAANGWCSAFVPKPS